MTPRGPSIDARMMFLKFSCSSDDDSGAIVVTLSCNPSVPRWT